MNEQEQIERGKLLAEVLGLGINAEDRVVTTWGTKTFLGLFRTVERILTEKDLIKIK